MFPSQAADRFSVRMPDGMRDRIAVAAKRNHRSMNSEIVMILANALGDEGQTATGSSPGKANPAAAAIEAALQGGSETQAMRMPG